MDACARLTRNVFVPGWILLIGIVFLLAPPMGVAASSSLGVAGIFVIPSIVLIFVAEPRAVAVPCPSR